MSPLADTGVVLRDAPWQVGAVRIGRARSVQPTAPAMQAAAQPAPVAQEDSRRARDEGLRDGRAEGLRLGLEEGRRTGYEEGLARGREAAQAQAQSALEAALAEPRLTLQQKAQRLDAVAAALERAAAGCLAGLEDELVALCLDVLARVLGPLAITPEGIQAQVRQLLASSGRTGELTVRLHPDDLPLLLQHKQADGAATRLRYVADAGVVLGGCLLGGGGAGEIDARLETILDECKAALLEQRRKASAPAHIVDVTGARP